MFCLVVRSLRVPLFVSLSLSGRFLGSPLSGSGLSPSLFPPPPSPPALSYIVTYGSSKFSAWCALPLSGDISGAINVFDETVETLARAHVMHGRAPVHACNVCVCVCVCVS